MDVSRHSSILLPGPLRANSTRVDNLVGEMIEWTSLFVEMPILRVCKNYLVRGRSVSRRRNVRAFYGEWMIGGLPMDR